MPAGRKQTAYSRMNRGQLTEHLRKKVLIGAISDDQRLIILRLHEDRLTREETRAQRTYEWKALLEPLKKEIASVNTSIYYFNLKKKRHDWRWHGQELPTLAEDVEAGLAANTAYYTLLVSLKERFMRAKSARETVSSLKAEYKKRYGQDALPNNGAHWVDWVRPNAKERILRLFSQREAAPGAKLRDPFPRKKWINPTSVGAAATPQRMVRHKASFGETSHPKGVRELADHVMGDGEFTPYEVNKED